MQLENCESGWAGSSQAVRQSGNAAGVAASPAADTGLGRDVGLLGRRIPGGLWAGWSDGLSCATLHLCTAGESLACTGNSRNSAGKVQEQRSLCCLSLVSKAK